MATREATITRHRLVQSITYANGASVHYTYDGANRVTLIEHRRAGASPNIMLRMDYTYYDNDLPWTITEKDDLSGTLTTRAVTTFIYDRRNRLISERRLIGDPYYRTYEYDAGGNRTLKVDVLSQQETRYFYDLADPAAYGSNNNRLMYAEVYDTAPMPDELRSATYYEYSADGNVTRVITEEFAVGGGQSGPMAPSGNRQFSAVRFGYAHNEQALLFAHGETWEWDGVSGSVSNYQKPWMREFRYDGARARYMNRTLNPDTLATLATTWSDYDGDDIYGDFTVSGNPAVATSTDKYEPGLWHRSAAGVVDYLHNDHLGTLRRQSSSAGAMLTGSAHVYTAFGERLAGANDPFGYVGAFGYQSHAEMSFLHVGHRYYEPASGRFLQRDPIGLDGGTNVYGYVLNRATAWIDPSGMQLDPGLHPEWFRPKPEEPISESPKDIQDELRDINNARTAVKGGAAGAALVLGVCWPPGGIAIAIALIINEVAEDWE